MNRFPWWKYGCIWLVLGAGVAGCADAPATDDVNLPTWESYLAAATRDYEGQPAYVVDGDIAVTREELRTLYDELVAERERERAGLGIVASPSTVNVVNGADDIWTKARARDLTYCVSDTFGMLKARAVREMAIATRDWEQHGNFNFRYVPAHDAACSNVNTAIVFSVRPSTVSGACAFFPSGGGGCVPRTLSMNFSSFPIGNATSQGVFRHEVGHILGLRHEHLRVPNTSCSEDSPSRAVTPYDSASVMHYPWCPGATHPGDLRITPRDAAGITQLYGPPKPNLDADMLWRHDNGQVAIWFIDDRGVITGEAHPGGQDPGGGWAIKGTGDFDGNGHADILWRHTSGQTAIWFMIDGAVVGQAYPGGTDPGLTWTIQNVGDFDADGRADILWRHVGGQVAIWFRGDSTRAAYPGYNNVPAPVDTAWQIKAVGDFDGNRRSDIVWRHTNGQVAIWFMDGAVRVGERAPGGQDPSAFWNIQAVGDFDGNSRDDILWRDANGLLAIWFGGEQTPDIPSHQNSGGPFDLSWRVAGVGDFNHDRRADIAWRHTDGTVGIWFMDGAAFVRDSYPRVAPSEWQLKGLLHE
jgi:hypothetical protein